MQILSNLFCIYTTLLLFQLKGLIFRINAYNIASKILDFVLIILSFSNLFIFSILFLCLLCINITNYLVLQYQFIVKNTVYFIDLPLLKIEKYIRNIHNAIIHTTDNQILFKERSLFYFISIIKIILIAFHTDMDIFNYVTTFYHKFNEMCRLILFDLHFLKLFFIIQCNVYPSEWQQQFKC